MESKKSNLKTLPMDDPEPESPAPLQVVANNNNKKCTLSSIIEK